MSWLIPSLPSWSRPSAASSSQLSTPQSSADIEEEDLDVPPQFPLPDSFQRSQAPAPLKSPKTPSQPAFNLLPPSPAKSDNGELPSELNIAIIQDAIPIGDMAPPVSTTKKPDFGIQNGGGLETSSSSLSTKPNGSGGGLGNKSKGKRGKVALGPGFSALDWNRLSQSGKNLRGTDTFPLRVTMDELKKHNTREDAWSVFNGRVYNITPYLSFHPGGVDELMRVAGRDGTKLFRLELITSSVDAFLGKSRVYDAGMYGGNAYKRVIPIGRAFHRRGNREVAI